MLGLVPTPAGRSSTSWPRDGDPAGLRLPAARAPEGLAFSFSGLKTAVLYAARGPKGKHATTP